MDNEGLITRLRKRVEIRRSIPRGEPDRISDILEEAAEMIESLRDENENRRCIVDDKTEILINGVFHYLNEYGGYRHYSLEALSSALTAERSMNHTLRSKLRVIKLPISQILLSAKSLDEALKS
jgi:hypothetical protein